MDSVCIPIVPSICSGTTNAIPPPAVYSFPFPKKRFHHAFKRNRVKRLMREAWRRNKASLCEICERDNISLDVALVYTATVIHSYEDMFVMTKKAVQEIVKKYTSR